MFVRTSRTRSAGARRVVATSLATALLLSPVVAVPVQAATGPTSGAQDDPVGDDASGARVIGAPQGPLEVDGRLCVGETLTVDPGIWQPDDTVLTYAWFADDVRLEGAEAQDLSIGPELLGAVLSAQVTGTIPDDDAGLPVTVSSVTTAAVPRCAVEGAVPTVLGAALVGQMLQASVDWLPAGTLSYQWSRNGAPIDGATSSAYVATTADLGATLSVTVSTVSDGHFPRTDVSAATSVVTGVLFGDEPTILGTARVGSALTAVTGSWTTSAQLSYRWTRDGTTIPGATTSTYVPTTTDLNAAIGVVVTGRAPFHPDLERQSKTVRVAAGVLSAPTPTISGTVQVGKRLTASAGTWSPAATLSYQWRANGAAISGATSSSYTVPASLYGRTIAVTVTGRATGYTTRTTTSATTKAVAAGAFTAPAPRISGTAQVGKRLTVSAGTWVPKASASYQWRANGAAIKGATSSSYTLPASLRGKKITVTVTGRATGYSTRSVTSVATKAVAYGTFSALTPRITGSARVGATLKATAGTWSPRASLSYQWRVNGAAIRGATRSTYTVKKTDHAKRVTVTVTGRATGYTTRSVTSRSTAIVLTTFAKTVAPRITGTVQVGKTLRATSGTWSPKASFSYQWRVNGRAVSGATRSTYTVRSGDKGKRISVTVTGRRSTYVTASRTSGSTAAVKAAPRPSRTTPVNEWDCPSWAPIKGNANSGIYHVPGGRYYERTKPEECFSSESAARAAGYRASRNG
ncbi:hypothetical protein IF650_09240 [Cellulosimicrobium terreum]|nr:hypothetical protein [Cellulosimicrobium terreum]